MTQIRLLTLFALTASLGGLGACASVQKDRDFRSLTLGEQTDFSTCVLSSIGTANLTPRGNTTSAVIDSIMTAPGKVQDAARTATYACAKGMHIDLNTVPGRNR